MWALRNIQRHSTKIVPLLQTRGLLRRDVFSQLLASEHSNYGPERERMFSSVFPLGCIDGARFMSTSIGRSMRSKVEKRMRRETGKTLREIRRAKKIRKKLMTDEERLLYSLRRAKKKIALLLQKLKKYELPELPSPRHDPELLTSEQLQAYKKIGFRNRNYCELGVRGVFGGVILNMHMHWKYHETVQVFCDNSPKEKIKEVAAMLARLSGGIVVNIHNVKTVIMFRGRNYRTPKNLVPLNTLTKRKALFKARFEQALESQKLNIKKIEQQLRRMGVNPEDPVAMASIQRVASTFFRAIDEKQGSPYVLQENKPSESKLSQHDEPETPSEDSDQEELDRFIEEIEGAADKEWEEEEAREKEEMSKTISYWNGRRRWLDAEGSGDEMRGQRKVQAGIKNSRWNRNVGGPSDGDEWDSNDEDGVSEFQSDDTSDSEMDERETRNEMRGSKGNLGSRERFRRKEAIVLSDDDLEDKEEEGYLGSHYVKTDPREFKDNDYYSGSDEE
ncbi:CRM-domain containing factor CFM9, mitochondrial-like isoform X2 [Aristolochia californica]|uniref:CRM-domain containing factor CFM9, mitochondrial-like isoform X2 n=1 Tax=Aristolochia californica TaxID=171875 RepID=UPI0035DB4CA1